MVESVGIVQTAAANSLQTSTDVPFLLQGSLYKRISAAGDNTSVYASPRACKPEYVFYHACHKDQVKAT